MKEVILEVHDVVRDYHLPRRSIFAKPETLRVLHGVSLELAKGRSLGIVGESGSGKSTLARTVMGLDRPQSGRVVIDGQDIYALEPQGLRRARRAFQAIFQDPYGSLDPRHTIKRIVCEPIVALEPETTSFARDERVREALEAVGLPPSASAKYPHEFSGGQRQRIAIARALITRPALIVADEPVSALDVSIQAQVLNLMMDLQEKLGLAYVFISHDLGVVRVITDRVAVIHLGRIVEEGPTQAVFDAPRHPYTRALIEAVPKPFSGRRRRSREDRSLAAPVDPSAKGEGCAYAPTCPMKKDICLSATPPPKAVTRDWFARCHFA